MSKEISNADDIIDSRDVIARIEELEGLKEEARVSDMAPLDRVAFSDPEAAELESLKKLAAEGDGVDDWEYGACLIRDSHFIDYAQELAEDLEGSGIREAQWPYRHIDWERAADELKQDYTAVEFDGVTYWAR